MALRRFFGSPDPGAPPPSPTPNEQAETDTIRRIVRELEAVDPARRRYLAGFAYVLARAAHADLNVDEDEARAMEEVVTRIGGLPEAQAILVVEIARNQAELYSGTEDFLVTREFNSTASPEEKKAAVSACFAVVASDHEITAEEFAELTEIADELGLTRPELNEIRREYSDSMSVVRKMRAQQDDAG